MSAEDSDQDMEQDMDLAQYQEMMDMADMEDVSLFWSMKIEPNKASEISEPAIPGYIVHITNACFGEAVTKNSRTVITVNKQDPICVLTQGTHENHSLDLLFNEAAEFAIEGLKPSIVYLTGYIQPPLQGNDELDPMQEDLTEAEVQELLQRQANQARLLDDEADDDKEEEPQMSEEIAEPPTKKQKTAKGTKSTKNGGNKSEKNKEKKRKSPQQKAVTATKSSEGSETKKSETKKSEKKKKNKKMQTMKGGIKYRDMKIGTGESVSQGDKVSVFYVGQTDDKKVFDKSIGGNGFEFTFGGGDVIKGWDLGLKGMKVGGKRKLVIPPKLAYGANGSPPTIPANATLTFTIEMKKIN